MCKRIVAVRRHAPHAVGLAQPRNAYSAVTYMSSRCCSIKNLSRFIRSVILHDAEPFTKKNKATGIITKVDNIGGNLGKGRYAWCRASDNGSPMV